MIELYGSFCNTWYDRAIVPGFLWCPGLYSAFNMRAGSPVIDNSNSNTCRAESFHFLIGLVAITLQRRRLLRVLRLVPAPDLLCFDRDRMLCILFIPTCQMRAEPRASVYCLHIVPVLYSIVLAQVSIADNPRSSRGDEKKKSREGLFYHSRTYHGKLVGIVR